MSLTNDQIETLFAFTSKKLVYAYDLQVELVDHLASSIEEEMEKDIKLNFDTALQKVYSRFGLFGFAHVVQQQESALEKQHKKLWRETIKSYFILPRVAFTIAVFLTIYFIITHIPELVAEKLLWITLIGSAIVGFKRSIHYRKPVRKPLLLTQFAPPVFYFPIICGIIPCIMVSSHKVSMLVIAFIIASCIIFQAAVEQINKQIRQKAKELYPEAFSVV